MARRLSRPTWIGAALIVFLTASLGVGALSGRTTRADTHGAVHHDALQTPTVNLTHPPEHRVPTIDGANDPSLIDDDAARILFLRMASHPDAVARTAYIKHMFRTAKPLASPEATRLAAIVAQYADRLDSLDHASTQDPYRIDRERQRRVMVEEFRQECGSALGSGGVARFDKIIVDNVKPKVRVFNRP